MHAALWPTQLSTRSGRLTVVAAASRGRDAPPVRPGKPPARSASSASKTGAAPTTHKRDEYGATRVVDAASVDLPAPAGEPAKAAPFNWLKQWYPLYVLDDLDKSKPHAVTLLGTPLAIWHDSAAWRAVADDCPHRRAPLSQGRIQDEGPGCKSSLVCSYHGWRFDGGGAPVAIPQATHDGPTIEKAALSSLRACVKSYPTREDDGLLWVWADGPGSVAEAEASPTPGCARARALDPSSITATTNQFYMRDFHVPHDELVGNLLSQDHVPWAHTGVASSRHSPYANHFEVSRVNEDRDAKGAALSFDLEWAPDSRALVKQEVTCVPPAYIEYFTPRDDGTFNVLYFYATPLAANRTRVFNHAIITQPMPALVSKLLAARGRVLDHLLLSEVFDGDLAFLCTTATNIKKADASGAGWARACYLPAGADAPFREWQKWLHSKGGGGWVASTTGAPPSTPPPTADLPRRTILDRYESHTRHCPSCSKALANVRRWGAAAKVGAAVAVLVGAVSAGGASAEGAGMVDSLAAAVGPLLTAGAAMAVAAGLRAAEDRFVFKEYEHWKG